MLINRMAQELGVTEDFIRALASGASYEYKTYMIRKKTGGQREINHPSRRLKAVQTWLLRTVLSKFPIHSASMAYRKGISILHNATLHTKSRYLLRMDLESFFSSIRAADFINFVENDIERSNQWSLEDVALLVSLLFRHDKLTMGAPTSPALSNILSYELDVEMAKLASRQGLTYSRYADDLFFSADKRESLRIAEAEVLKIIPALSVPANLKVNLAKTIHSSRRGRRQITGIVLGSDGKTHVARTYKRMIRAMIFKFDSLSEIQQVALPGMISYVIGFEPEFLNSLIAKYGFDEMKRIQALRPLLDRQRIHLPKMNPSPTKKGRKSANDILKDVLRSAGYEIGLD